MHADCYLERLFIMDGVISLPVALAGFYFIPDVPEISRAPYFTKEVRGFKYVAMCGGN